jgi:hypothetical protein
MTNRSTRDELAPLSIEDPLFETVLDLRIAAMHDLLDRMAAESPAVALNALRAHFPEASLDQRVKAIAARRH